MNMEHMSCPACAAPVSIAPGASQATCTFCGATLRVQRSDGEVALLASEKMANAIVDSSAQTQAAIGESTAATRDELRRLQLTQELSSLELRLASVQSEIRTLSRMPEDKVAKQQLRQLQDQEKGITKRIAEINAILNPAPVAAPVAVKTAKQGANRGCIGWSLLILAWLFFWPFMLTWKLIRAKSKPVQIVGYAMAGVLGIWILFIAITSPSKSRTSDTAAVKPTSQPSTLGKALAAATTSADEVVEVAQRSPTDVASVPATETPMPPTATPEPLTATPTSELSLESLFPTATSAPPIPEAPPQESAAQEPQTATLAPIMGQDIVLGNLRYRVLEAVDSGQALTSDNQFIESRSTAGRFVRVVFEVENLDKDQTSFLGVDLVDDQERKYGSFDEGFMYTPTERQCVLTLLNPNLPQTCEYIFEVPADATGLKLKVTDQVPFVGQEALVDLNL